MEKTAIVGAGTGTRPDVLKAVSDAMNNDRVEIERDAGAEAVGELKDVIKDSDQADIALRIRLVDQMNREMDRNESLREFILGLHKTITRTGKAIPRKILMENGIKKRDLDKLVRLGFLKEVYLRHGGSGALYACVRLPDNVSFYGKQAVAVVPEVSVQEDVAASIRDSLGGVQEVVNTSVDGGDNCAEEDR